MVGTICACVVKFGYTKVVWVGFECVGKAVRGVRDRVCLECVSRVEQVSIGQGGVGWDGKGLDVVQYGGVGRV